MYWSMIEKFGFLYNYDALINYDTGKKPKNPM